MPIFRDGKPTRLQESGMMQSGARVAAPSESARLARGRPWRVKGGSGAGQVAAPSSCQAPAPLRVTLSVRPRPECPQSGLGVPPSFLPRNQSLSTPLCPWKALRPASLPCTRCLGTFISSAPQKQPTSGTQVQGHSIVLGGKYAGALPLLPLDYDLLTGRSRENGS